eukprot:5012814-Prymnesium_polylepis.1
MSQSSQPFLLASAVDENQNFKGELKQEHRQTQNDEEQEYACMASDRKRSQPTWATLLSTPLQPLAQPSHL